MLSQKQLLKKNALDVLFLFLYCKNTHKKGNTGI